MPPTSSETSRRAPDPSEAMHARARLPACLPGRANSAQEMRDIRPPVTRASFVEFQPGGTEEAARQQAMPVEQEGDGL